MIVREGAEETQIWLPRLDPFFTTKYRQGDFINCHWDRDYSSLQKTGGEQ